MSIFIGRNIQEEAVHWLRQRPVDYVEQPLINIQLEVFNNSFFREIGGKKKQWLITSKWAAEWIVRNQKHLDFKAFDFLYCISEKLAEVLRLVTPNVEVSEKTNALSLAKLIREKNKGEKVIYLRGDRSLDVLKTNLKVLGRNYIEWEVYKSKLQKPPVKMPFDAYLFFSPGGIESFIQGGNSIPSGATVVAIGQTTGKKAGEIFTNQILISPLQDELFMVQLAYSKLKRKELEKKREKCFSNKNYL